MQMLDYRIHYAVMATEERVRTMRQKQRLLAQLEREQRESERQESGPRRWTVLVGRLVAMLDTR